MELWTNYPNRPGLVTPKWWGPGESWFKPSCAGGPAQEGMCDRAVTLWQSLHFLAPLQGHAEQRFCPLFLSNVKILTRSPFPTVTFVPEFQSTGVLRAVSSGVMGSCDPLLWHWALQYKPGRHSPLAKHLALLGMTLLNRSPPCLC